MQTDDDEAGRPLEPLPEFEAFLSDPQLRKAYKQFRADTEEADHRLEGVLTRLREVDGLPQELLWDLVILLRDYQRLRIAEKRGRIAEAKADDVAERRDMTIRVATEIEASRSGLSSRSLAVLVHRKLQGMGLVGLGLPSVETIRKVIAEERKKSGR